MDNSQETLAVGRRQNYQTVTTNIGGVQDILMNVDSGDSCNVIDRYPWEELKKRKDIR